MPWLDVSLEVLARCLVMWMVVILMVDKRKENKFNKNYLISSFHLLPLIWGIISADLMYKKVSNYKAYPNMDIKIHYAGLFKKRSRLTNKTCSSLKDPFSNKEENRLCHQMFLSTLRGISSHHPQGAKYRKWCFYLLSQWVSLDFLRQSCKVKRKTFILFFGTLQKIACFRLMRLKLLKLGVITTNTVVTRNLQFCWFCVLKSLALYHPSIY